jgi:hypothetical protein
MRKNRERVSKDARNSNVARSMSAAHVESGPERRADLSRVSFHLSLFNILFGLTFAYFVYFSHQKIGAQAELVSKITEINAINVPYAFQFLTIDGHKEYYYLKRRDALMDEFLSLITELGRKDLSDGDLSKLGSETQKVLTQIAYFFPYKKMLDFKKDGAVSFDPNQHESIDTKDEVNIAFLKTKIDEIYNWNYALTLPLKDARDRIAKAMVLAGWFKDEYTQMRVSKYLDSLVAYLEKHYELAIPLGLTIKRYEYLLSKITKAKIVTAIGVLGSNFVLGVLVPLFWKSRRDSTALEVATQLTFGIGIILLFKEAIFSMPF